VKCRFIGRGVAGRPGTGLEHLANQSRLAALPGARNHLQEPPGLGEPPRKNAPLGSGEFRVLRFAHGVE
jgi:hypothetical protein